MSRPRLAVATTAKLAVAATLGAAAVGALRQRHEQAQVRRGERPPAAAASDLPPGHPPSLVTERLSAWLPARPRRPLGRALTTVWAGPLTAVGLLMAALGRGRCRWDRERGCWVVVGVRGPSGVALRAVGAHANAIGHVILSRHPEPPASLLDHEAVHVRQAERLGPLLFPVYVWLGARYGYRDHPLERAARAGARAAAG